MAKNDGSVIIDTRMDTGGFEKGVKSMKSQVNGLTNAVNKLGVAIGAAFAVKKLIQFGKEAIELGSDLQEVQNVVDVTFTTMSDKVNEFAQGAAEAAGLSETMAKKYVGTFGAMAKAFGFAESESYNMATALTQLSGDVASFYNLTQDEAYTKLKSVFTGETETLKDLGVVMTQSALDSYAMAEGYGKTTKQMSEQEKVALRYSFVLDQLSAAQGDFVRTSDSWANQTRILKLNLESIMATFGQGLINFFTPVIKLINTLLSKVATLANAFKAFSEMIMGTSGGGGSSGTGQAAAAVGELADGYNDATQGAEDLAGATEKANKANKKYLSGLDEIRTFQSETKDSGDISVGGIMGEPVDFGSINTEGEKTSTIFDGLIKKAKELADIFKSGFMDGLGDFQPRLDSIKESISSIKESLTEIFTDAGVQEAANNFVKTFVYALGQVVGSIASIGLTIGTNLVGGIAKYLAQNTERIKQYFINMFNVGAEISASIGNLFSSLAYIFEAFASETAQQMTADLISILSEVFMTITEISGKLVADLVSLVSQPIMDSKEAIKGALEDLIAGIQKVTEFLSKLVADIGKFLRQIYDEIIAPIFDNIKERLTLLLQDSISPFVSQVGELLGAIGEALTALWEGFLRPLVQWIIDNILPVLTPIINGVVDNVFNAITRICDLITGVIQVLTGLIDFIVGVFTGDWEKAWNGVKDIFAGIFELFAAIIKAPINAVISLINGLISGVVAGINLIIQGLNSLKFEVPDWVPFIGGSKLGFNIREMVPFQIPYLATGAVIPPNAPFLAMLGDQKHGTNIEAPLDTIKQAVREVVGNGSGGGGQYRFSAQINRRVLFEEFIEEAKLQMSMTGHNPLDLRT